MDEVDGAQYSEDEEEDEEDEEESSDDESEEEGEPVAHWAQRPQPPVAEPEEPVAVSYSAIAAAAQFVHDGSLAEAIELSQHACAPGNKKIGRIGREKEYADIACALNEAVATHTGGNMYICGPPGTGKTHFTNAAIEELCANSESSDDTEDAPGSTASARDPATILALTGISGVVPVYRMPAERSAAAEFVVVRTLGTADSEASIFGKIFAAIYPFLPQTTRNTLKRDVTSGKRAGDGTGTKVSLAAKIKKAVLDYLSCSATKPHRCMVLLVVDEVDKAPKSILKELLELAPEFDDEASTNSNLVCMGIANSLNFPEQIGLSGHAKPKIVLFCPYQYDALMGIIRNRTYGLLDVRAEALIARKVASKNGDVRLALQVAQQSIDSGVAELVKPPLEEEGEAGVRRVEEERAALLAAPSKYVANVARCLKVFQSVGMGSSRDPDLISKLSSVCRAVLIALVTSNLQMPMQVPKMLQAYNSYAEEVHLNPLTKDELRRWLEQLIGYGLIRCSDDAGNGRRQVHKDSVNYRLQCEAVNVLRVPNLENIHKPHVQRFVDRQNKGNVEKARLLAENLKSDGMC
jgi:Cdc6-like AAA superfamily ATPase